MTERTAACTCSALRIITRGEPTKISACHCQSCQRRTGSAFSVAVFFDAEQTAQAGPSQTFVRLGDSGQPVEFHFCPICGTSVFWYPAFRPGKVGVAIGCFDPAEQLVPSQAVYEQDRLSWATIETRAPPT